MPQALLYKYYFFFGQRVFEYILSMANCFEPEKLNIQIIKIWCIVQK